MQSGDVETRVEERPTGADAATVTRWLQIADPFGTYVGLAGCSARLGGGKFMAKTWKTFGFRAMPCKLAMGAAHGPRVDSRILPTQKCIRWILPRIATKDAGLEICVEHPLRDAFLETCRE